MLGHEVSKCLAIIPKIKEVGICIASIKLGFPRKAPWHFLMHHFRASALAHCKAQLTHYRRINAIFISCSSCKHFKHFIPKMDEIPYESNFSSSVH